MNIKGKPFRTIWQKEEDPGCIQIIDQRWLPHEFRIEDLKTAEDVATAIKEMHLRGAPLIGAAGAFGIYLALLNAPEKGFDLYLWENAEMLKNTRPTAVNLAWAVDRVMEAIKTKKSLSEKTVIARETAREIVEKSVSSCRGIGEHGLSLIESISREKNGEAVNILTHCNAGWLACIDYGTATAPIYLAHDKGIKVHVWVDETRPRNQGARITAFELNEEGVPHTVITDNAGGHLMQHGMVDMVIVGTDRTTIRGDVANKIGTYLKALAAKDNNIPFYVAAPSSSIDFSLRDGLAEIPIEERHADEVKYIRGFVDGKVKKVLLTPEGSPAANYAFDVTPARLVTALITERGICAAREASILDLFPEGRMKVLKQE